MKTAEELKKLFIRDLDKVMQELNSFDHSESLWEVKGQIANSAGNLIMHICGNLQYFIGTVLDSTGYERDREEEFSGNVSVDSLQEEIVETKNVIATYLDKVTDDELSYPYPQQPFGYPMTKFHFLIHLYGHLNYHLGQINYHRRLIS